MGKLKSDDDKTKPPLKLEGTNLLPSLEGAHCEASLPSKSMMASEGAKVAINARGEARCAEVLEEILAQGGEAMAVVGDISDSDFTVHLTRCATLPVHHEQVPLNRDAEQIQSSWCRWADNLACDIKCRGMAGAYEFVLFGHPGNRTAQVSATA